MVCHLSRQRSTSMNSSIKLSLTVTVACCVLIASGESAKAGWKKQTPVVTGKGAASGTFSATGSCSSGGLGINGQPMISDGDSDSEAGYLKLEYKWDDCEDVEDTNFTCSYTRNISW